MFFEKQEENYFSQLGQFGIYSQIGYQNIPY
jgi:hypothetical protein